MDKKLILPIIAICLAFASLGCEIVVDKWTIDEQSKQVEELRADLKKAKSQNQALAIENKELNEQVFQMYEELEMLEQEIQELEELPK